MPPLTSSIASWPSAQNFGTKRRGPQGIASEPEIHESPDWQKCIDGLLAAFSNVGLPSDVPRPNREALTAALMWMRYLRSKNPGAPPTCIIPEPAGGVIVERMHIDSAGRKRIVELTFTNAKTAEVAIYVDGRVVEMDACSWHPMDETD